MYNDIIMTSIRWQAKDFIYKKKTVNWYWVTGIFIFLGIFSSIYFFKNYLSGLVIFLYGILILFAGASKPSIKNYEINDKGILLYNGKKLIPYDNLKKYNIDFENQKIIFTQKNTRKLDLIYIPFEKNQAINKIDKFLSTKLKKDEELKIPTGQLILRKFLGV